MLLINIISLNLNKNLNTKSLNEHLLLLIRYSHLIGVPFSKRKHPTMENESLVRLLVKMTIEKAIQEV